MFREFKNMIDIANCDTGISCFSLRIYILNSLVLVTLCFLTQSRDDVDWPAYYRTCYKSVSE